MITLAAEPRDALGKAVAALRENGRIPAVMYGAKREATPISVNAHDFMMVFRDAGESTVIELTGLSTPTQALIHEVDRDPVTGDARHADFYVVEKGAKVEVAVPLSFVGEAPAVKLGANLVKVLHELEIEADPANLPHEIEVDISVLVEVGDQIHAKDIRLPAGVTLMIEPEEVVALTQEVEQETEEAASADMSSIEVEQKGKGEEEEAS